MAQNKENVIKTLYAPGDCHEIIVFLHNYPFSPSIRRSLGSQIKPK